MSKRTFELNAIISEMNYLEMNVEYLKEQTREDKETLRTKASELHKRVLEFKYPDVLNSKKDNLELDRILIKVKKIIEKISLQ